MARKAATRPGFFQILTLCVLLVGLVVSLVLLGQRQEIFERAQESSWQLYYQTDFSNFDGWEVKERDGKAQITNETLAHLSCRGEKYPVIARWNGFEKPGDRLFPESGDFRLEVKFRVHKPEGVAGYGVSGWASAWCEGFPNNFKEFFGFTWHPKEGLELRLFEKKKKLPVDTGEHQVQLVKKGETWVFRLDGTNQLSGIDPNPEQCHQPDSLRFGDPTVQKSGIWPVMNIDWVKVYETPSIALKEEGDKNNLHYWLYENTRYPCGKNGYHQFLVIQKGKEINKRKLLVGFRGGGAGFYKSNGSYFPDSSFEDFLDANKEKEALFRAALGDGLIKIIRNKDDWRIMGPSYCSHDFYLGRGETNPDFKRWGYKAAEEAINFTQSHFPTEKIVIYGVSAGASGAFYHGYQRDRVAGIVMDSNSMDLLAVRQNCNQGRPICCFGINICQCSDLQKNCLDIMAERTRFTIGADEPHLLINQGKVGKPIYFIWNEKDVAYFGENAKYFMSNLTKAIRDHNPGGRSVAKKVCIPTNACNLHGPTGYDGDVAREVANWMGSL